jgi:pantothenate kinase
MDLHGLLPEGAAGIDAGMTLTKIALASDGAVDVSARETPAGHGGADLPALGDGIASVGVTGARVGALASREGVVAVQEIEAAARGCTALLQAQQRLAPGDFLMALMGTGTAFASVRGSRVNHMGGTALGGGSFSGIAARVAPEMLYRDWIAAAARGDRRNVDTMISDVYPGGLGRIGPDLTAAHLSRAASGAGAGSLDDFLAGLLNLHGENIAQIAAGRAAMASAGRIVLCGMFVHDNPALVESLTHMLGLFGVAAETVPAPGYAGAIGAALLAAEASDPTPP